MASPFADERLSLVLSSKAERLKKIFRENKYS